MARNKDIPQVWEHASGGGGSGIGISYLRDMTPTELAERDARQKAYNDMLARQQAYEEFARYPAARTALSCRRHCRGKGAPTELANKALVNPVGLRGWARMCRGFGLLGLAPG